ncbi:trypsin-like peptidase domain-containing protein [Pseudomonas sp. D(2018)]|uniref:trypsin-like peptidase domain-containing protein n=1 Tax=Pseudomonas sp. D(2018) TaxID=2502238 RepID=UPI0010F9A9AE|nr:trypsin-like peptidase domain-containing protein [Pseudomonas sp. D(2018)]
MARCSSTAEFTDEEMGAIERFLISCTVPLIYQNAQRTCVLGTGTFFEVSDRHFLVTAGHLFEGIDPNNLGVPERSGQDVHIVTIGHGTIYHPKDTDEHDVAVIELLDTDFLRLVQSGWQFLSMANVATPDPTTTTYIVAGHPDETVSYDSGVLRPAALFQIYTGRYEGEVASNRSKFDLYLRYGQQASNTYGFKKDTPHLGGVSGASVYAVTPSQSIIWAPEGILRIVGIQVAFVNESRKYLHAKTWPLVEHVLKLALDPSPK